MENAAAVLLLLAKALPVEGIWVDGAIPLSIPAFHKVCLEVPDEVVGSLALHKGRSRAGQSAQSSKEATRTACRVLCLSEDVYSPVVLELLTLPAAIRFAISAPRWVRV